jgi:hypothetical protein
MASKSISVGDHVHYAPENLEAENASLTPVWIIVETNPTYSVLKQIGAPELSEAYQAPTKDLVATSPDDPTEQTPVADK